MPCPVSHISITTHLTVGPDVPVTSHMTMIPALQDVWDYAQRMNDTQRQEVALIPDMQLRNFVIRSSTPPSLLMETVYNNTMERVPYEQARA